MPMLHFKINWNVCSLYFDEETRKSLWDLSRDGDSVKLLVWCQDGRLLEKITCDFDAKNNGESVFMPLDSSIRPSSAKTRVPNYGEDSNRFIMNNCNNSSFMNNLEIAPQYELTRSVNSPIKGNDPQASSQEAKKIKKELESSLSGVLEMEEPNEVPNKTIND